jgi:hypothetical protein
MEDIHQNIKDYFTDLITQNLQDFELVDGGQQRTIGDLVENKVIEIITADTNPLISEVKLSTGKKSMEDVSVVSDGVRYLLDPKSHNVDSEFSMPNLTSISKIKKLYSTPKQELLYVFVDYQIEGQTVLIKGIKVLFLWELDMSMLGVGALGKGQLQIKNLNDDLVITDEGKEAWYDKLKVEVNKYLDKQIIKIAKQKKEWE